MDAVRGTAVVLVVLYHAVIALDVVGVEPPRWVAATTNGLSPLRIPVLVLLSGLLLPLSLRKPPGTYVDGKLRLIGWPWLVWTCVTVLVLTAGSHVAGDGNFGPARIAQFVVSPQTYTWYLLHLLLYYLLALVLPPRVRSALVVPLLLVAFLDQPEALRRLLFLFGVFLLGDHLARVRPSLALPRHPAVVPVAAVCAAVFAGLSAGGVDTRYRPVSVVGVLATVVVLAAVARRWRSAAPVRAAAALGRDSIVYYTTHWVAVAVTANVLALAGVRRAVLATALLVLVGLLVPAVAVRYRAVPVVGLLYALPPWSRSGTPTLQRPARAARRGRA
nr:acyltransferase family protein [Kineococcus siccus]